MEAQAPEVFPPHYFCPDDHSFCVIVAECWTPILVDRDIYDTYGQLNWRVRDGIYPYIAKSGSNGSRLVYLHRLVMNTPPGMETDHIDGVTLDARRCNLRIATLKQNRRNRGIGKRNSTGYKGVWFWAARGKWKAQIMADGKLHHIGLFDSPEQAAQAYNEAAIRLHGEFARLNVIPASEEARP